MALARSIFGETTSNDIADLFTLTNNDGMTVKITNYGGIVTAIDVPDRNGRPGDVVLGFDNLADYLAGHPYFGAIVGRYANRIAEGRFPLGDTICEITLNRPPVHLHGGEVGFDKMIWAVEAESSEAGDELKLTQYSPDGDEGFPGNLSVSVTYRLAHRNELEIDYQATTDKLTVLNLTNHSYFNLAGAGSGQISAHHVTIDADHYTPTDERQVPTGEIRSVAGTPMDLRKPVPIGERIDSDYRQLQISGGFDHNWVLNHAPDTLGQAARVRDPSSGRVLEVLTTEPGVQFYTGNFLADGILGKAGQLYGHRGAFCLETQHFPDSPNHPEFPGTTLRPGETFRSTTVYRFTAEG